MSLLAVDDEIRPGTYLEGEWRTTGEHLPVIDPATGEQWSTVDLAGADEVDAAVAAARAAAPGWAATSPSERGAILNKWSALIFQNLELLAALEARNVGKPLSGGRLNAIIAGSIIQYAAGAADRPIGVTLPTRSPDFVGYTRREPFGVSAIVLPWNVPAVLAAANLAPSLGAGNAVVLKPSEVAPLVTLAMVELAAEAGVPPGVLNVITGYGPTVGAPLVAHRGVDHVTFVGSTVTGASIMRAAADHLVPVKMELGGKSPNVLFADADLDAAIPAIVQGITENAGQNCNAGSRLLVQDTIADEAIDRVVAGMEAVRVGAWSDDLDMGPLVSSRQYERVMGILDRARDSGAKTILGGGRPAGVGAEGNFVAPTVVTGFETGAPVAGEEIFGPVLTIERFAQDDDAIELANNTDFGLLACVWTSDVSRALRVANALVAGQVTVNQYSDAGVIGMPFNMAKASGFSSGNGYNSIEAFTREKAVAIKLLGGAASAW